MYYVSGTKVYSSEKDPKTKIYPEVKLHKKADGTLYMKYLASGVSTKPKQRQICLAAEVFAQLGSIATVEAPAKAE